MVPRKWPQGIDWFAKLNLLVRTILQRRLVPLAGKLILGCSADNFVLNEDRGNTFRLIKTNPQKSYISWQNWSRGARLAITLQWKRLLWLVWVGTNGGVVMSPLNRERTRLLSRFLRNKEKCVGHWLFEYISFENQFRSMTLGPNKGSLLTPLSSMSLVLI